MDSLTHEDGDEHLHPPLSNSVKDNTDVAIFEETDCYNHAFIIQNNAWSLVESRSRCKRDEPNPDLAETMKIREVLSLINENNHIISLLNLIVCRQYRLFVAPSFAFFIWEEWLTNDVTCLKTLVTKTQYLDLLNGQRIFLITNQIDTTVLLPIVFGG